MSAHNLRFIRQDIQSMHANVVDIEHNRVDAGLRVDEVDIVVHVETRGQDHCQALLAHLAEGGYRILHREVACGGCGLETCVVERKRCITAIGVGEAVAACRDILSARTHAD